MQTLKRWFITLLCLVAAIGCYFFGAPAGGVMFLIVGAVMELIFWYRVLAKKPK